MFLTYPLKFAPFLAIIAVAFNKQLSNRYGIIRQYP